MEHYFQCPQCGEEISVIVDTSVEKQKFIEDCEVCCRPIEIEVEIENSAVKIFTANKTD